MHIYANWHSNAVKYIEFTLKMYNIVNLLHYDEQTTKWILFRSNATLHTMRLILHSSKTEDRNTISFNCVES